MTTHMSSSVTTPTEGGSSHDSPPISSTRAHRSRSSSVKVHHQQQSATITEEPIMRVVIEASTNNSDNESNNDANNNSRCSTDVTITIDEETPAIAPEGNNSQAPPTQTNVRGISAGSQASSIGHGIILNEPPVGSHHRRAVTFDGPFLDLGHAPRKVPFTVAQFDFPTDNVPALAKRYRFLAAKKHSSPIDRLIQTNARLPPLDQVQIEWMLRQETMLQSLKKQQQQRQQHGGADYGEALQQQQDKGAVLDATKLLEVSNMDVPDDVVAAKATESNLTSVAQDEAALFVNLACLDVGENSLQFEDLSPFRALRKLNMQCNGLTYLRCTEGMFTLLEQLDLSFNALSWDSIPQLFALPRLKKLDLSCNDLHSLPADLSGLRALERLNLEKNKFNNEENIFFALATIPNLIELNLNYNFLRRIPPRIQPGSPPPLPHHQQAYSNNGTGVNNATTSPAAVASGGTSTYHPLVPNNMYTFPRLEVLHLGRNKISYFEDLYPLIEWERLKTVVIWGNPIRKRRKDLEVITLEMNTVHKELIIDDVPVNGTQGPVFEKGAFQKIKIEEPVMLLSKNKFKNDNVHVPPVVVPPLNNHNHNGPSFFMTEGDDGNDFMIDQQLRPITTTTATMSGTGVGDYASDGGYGVDSVTAGVLSNDDQYTSSSLMDGEQDDCLDDNAASTPTASHSQQLSPVAHNNKQLSRSATAYSTTATAGGGSSLSALSTTRSTSSIATGGSTSVVDYLKNYNQRFHNKTHHHNHSNTSNLSRRSTGSKPQPRTHHHQHHHSVPAPQRVQGVNNDDDDDDDDDDEYENPYHNYSWFGQHLTSNSSNNNFNNSNNNNKKNTMYDYDDDASSTASSRMESARTNRGTLSRASTADSERQLEMLQRRLLESRESMGRPGQRGGRGANATDAKRALRALRHALNHPISEKFGSPKPRSFAKPTQSYEFSLKAKGAPT